ncbi:MAG: hypothetical protein V1870_04235 [Candidatus Aenigmatarchaeota archaeon]
MGLKESKLVKILTEIERPSDDFYRQNYGARIKSIDDSPTLVVIFYIKNKPFVYERYIKHYGKYFSQRTKSKISRPPDKRHFISVDYGNRFSQTIGIENSDVNNLEIIANEITEQWQGKYSPDINDGSGGYENSDTDNWDFDLKKLHKLVKADKSKEDMI